MALPVAFPLAADRRGHGVADDAVGERAVALAAMIGQPSGVRGVLVKVLRRNVVMLAANHAAQAREIAFRLIGADAVEAVGLAVIDALYREKGVQHVPMRGFVGVDFGAVGDALAGVTGFGRLGQSPPGTALAARQVLAQLVL